MNPHDNLFHFFDALHPIVAREGFIGPNYSWIRDTEGTRLWPNRCYRLTELAPAKASVLQELAEAIEQERAPKEIQLTDLPYHRGNIDWLEQHGFQIKRRCPEMSVTSQRYLAPVSPREQSAIVCRRIDSEIDYHAWATLVGDGFYRSRAQQIDRQFLECFRQNPCFAFFLTRVDGTPAATTMTFTSPESQGIYLVYVDPQFRHRGLGSQIVDAAVRQGFEAGHNTVILQASAEGEPLYRKLGFVVDFNYLLMFRSRKE